MDARQELLFKTGDKALFDNDPTLMRNTIQLILLFNRSLLEKARQARKLGKIEEAERYRQSILHGIQTIEHFKTRIKMAEN